MWKLGGVDFQKYSRQLCSQALQAGGLFHLSPPMKYFRNINTLKADLANRSCSILQIGLKNLLVNYIHRPYNLS